jgi:hypothetical protein
VPERLVPLGVALALAGAMITACYDVPRPDCGFICGPGGACPEGYSCASDMRCHRNGTSPDLVCASPDAALPVDAASDVADDAADDNARGR